MFGNRYNKENTSSCSPYMVWRNYSIGLISIAMVPLLCGLLKTALYPFFTLALSLALFLFVRSNRVSKSESCAIIPYIVARILLVFTFLSVIVELALRWCIPDVVEISIFISILVLAPTALVMLIFARKKNINGTFCMDCMLRNGTPYERAVMGHFYSTENKYLIPHLIGMFSLISVISWIHFLLFFKFGNPYDTIGYLIYVFLPVIFILIDVSLLRIRYLLIGYYYKKKYDAQQNLIPSLQDGVKTIRIILVHKDRIFYCKGKDGLFDTPFKFEREYTNAISKNSAHQYMSNVIGFVPEDSVRFCYSTEDVVNRRSIEHYFCFVKDESKFPIFMNVAGFDGVWMDKAELDKNFDENNFTKMACSEIHRVYTVLITSKKFSINGDRKVSIKGYTPSLFIEDLDKTDVDFNDNRWMVLSRFNKDRLFYRLKVFWYKYIEGLG